MVALAAACAMGVSAQRASDTSEFSFWDNEGVDQKIVIGPRVGLNVSNMSFDVPYGDEFEGQKSKIGFNVGVAVDFILNRSFAINSGLYYTTKGVKFEDGDVDWKETETSNAGYIQLPVYASYRLNFAEASQLQINFGPYVAYGVNGKITNKYEDFEDPEYNEESKMDLFGTSEGDKERGGFKRFDFGLGVGAGYTFHRVYLGLDYQFGLVNCLDKKEWGAFKGKTSNLSITVGYNF